MNKVEKCEHLVKSIYDQFDGSHDYQHIERVMMNANTILKSEPTANAKLVHLAVLLHDVSDPKYTTGKENEIAILNQLDLTKEEIRQIREIIASVSFRGGNEFKAKSLEAMIVRDADRLDAIGAVGIARTFAFGGVKGRRLYDPEEEIRHQMTEDEYRKKETASVTHFYEKLLLLKDLMTTAKGKKLAEGRHQFMIDFLKQLKLERDGKL